MLKNASKSGKGQRYPEFIITTDLEKDFIIINECKADVKKHESENRDKYADFAVDGVLNYAAYLSKEFNVIAIATSGQNEKEFKVSNFYGQKEWLHIKNYLIKKILSLQDYIDIVNDDPHIKQKKHSDLIAFSLINI